MNRRSMALSTTIVITLVLGGCNSKTAGPSAPVDEVAKRKLDAINRLAEALAKDPNSDQTFVALEDFRNNYFNPKTQPDIAKQILEVYDTKIKGKYKGQHAQEVDAAINVFRADMNRS